MYIFTIPANFRIKSKQDAERFLTISKGSFHWSDGKFDYIMENGSVCWRPIFMRGNIFNPYCDDGKNYVELIWRNRKYINAELRGDN